MNTANMRTVAPLLVLLAGVWTGALAAPPVLPKGLGVDEAKEKVLAGVLDKLVAALEAETIDHAALLTDITAARKVTGELSAIVKQKETPSPPDTPRLPEKTPLVLYGGAGRDDAIRLLREQLDFYVRSAHGMFNGRAKYLLEWTGRGGFRTPQRRVPSMVAALREAARVAMLLSRPAEQVHVAKGEQLFADDFSKGTAHWLPYGQCVTKNEGDAFRMTDERRPHPDAMMWTKRQFDGDFVAEFTFIPHSVGGRAGALFTICGTPKAGKTLAVCVGRTMDTYNYGINGYHFSMHRGTTGLGNVRRVGPGLKLLISGKDPCPTPGRAYRVAIGKVASTLFLMVDGKLIHQYLDAATHGPLLTAGHVGLRHWAGMDASYRQFAVYRLQRRAAPTAPRPGGEAAGSSAE